MFNKLIIYFFPIILLCQHEPIEDLHINPPRVWTLTNANIHTNPGDFIKNGSIIIREGKIESVGRYIKPPKDSYEIDLKGAHVYAGFIESWLVTESLEQTSSIRSHWDGKIRTEYRSTDNFTIQDDDLKELRQLGFTTAHLTPSEGIFRGQSGIISLEKNPKPINTSISQIIDFRYKSKNWRLFPRSLLGVIAHIRQTFYDSEWYLKAQKIFESYPDQNEPLVANITLESLGMSRELGIPFTFICSDENYSNRALNIANEFDLDIWIMGSGYEYRRLELFKEKDPFFILPVNFPSKPNIIKSYSNLQYSTEKLKHWDMAPDNISYILNKGYDFSITSFGLNDKSQFRKNLKRIIDRGVREESVLAALTTTPAEAMGMEKSLGKIAPGFDANLVIVDGEYFNSDSRIVSVWINGNEHYIAPRKIESFYGTWSLKYSGTSYQMIIEDPLENISDQIFYKGYIKIKNKIIDLNEIDIFESSITFSLEGKNLGLKNNLSFSGDLLNNQITGIVNSHQDNPLPFQADKKESLNNIDSKTESFSDLSIFYPEGAYGIIKNYSKPNAILINDATLWTCGPKGTLAEWDLLCVDGKIKQVAPDITVPQGSAVIIEGAGKHVTPGLIDCHSHSAASAINEGTQYITSEVRMRDVLDADDINIYRQLGGGLTTANILHGSANPIGGQNAVIKLRWGANPNDLLFKNAPEGIKFALGENVKQANWNGTDRYPQTRMGVEQVIRDAFRAALDYKNEIETYKRNSKLQRTKIPPRKNLELDALVEILDGKRLVHCHSYRQDEIIMLTRIAEDFGFKIATFQHVLEGYKVAERISEHGAGASTFSDWWQYKLEVMDAIPYNGALMTKNDVVVSYNSDDDEMARRLNTEAAKSIQYGGLDPNEALNLVTINPAKQLKIDQWVGSLEPKKDADFVIWDGEPLSVYSKVEETWIDGIRYYSTKENELLEERDSVLRKKIIQKILLSTNKEDQKKNTLIKTGDDETDYHCDSIDETGIYKDE